MAFPQIAGSTTSTDAVSDTNHVVSLPASIAAGDLLLVFHYGSGNDATPNSASTGWTVLKERPANFNVGHLVCLYRVADGSEGATMTITTDLAELSSAIAVRITDWHGTSAPEVSTGLAATSANPDPDTVTPSWGVEDTLWIAALGIDGVPTITGYPSNMADNNLSAASSGEGDVAIASAESAAASFNPNTFTNSASAHYGAFTVAVRPAAAAAGGQPTQRRHGGVVHMGTAKFKGGHQGGPWGRVRAQEQQAA